jgi:hypothetical protein
MTFNQHDTRLITESEPTSTPLKEWCVQWIPVIAQYSLYLGLIVYYTRYAFFNNQNPVLARPTQDAGHALTYLAMVTFALIIRIILPYTKRGFFYSLVILIFAFGISEGSFNVYYLTLISQNVEFTTVLYHGIVINYLFDFLILATLIGITFKVQNILNRKYLITGIIILELYFGIWLIGGQFLLGQLPITLSSALTFAVGNSPTPLYANIWINTIEIGQWILTPLIFIIALIKGDTKNENNKITNLRFLDNLLSDSSSTINDTTEKPNINS